MNTISTENAKPNRPHYRIDTHLGYEKWAPTNQLLCVFHARRLWTRSSGYRLTALTNGRNGNSRPSKSKKHHCCQCLKDNFRCEHDMQGEKCPMIPGDTCGRDSSEELGGSW